MEKTYSDIIGILSDYLDAGVVIMGPHGHKDKKLRIYCGGGDVGKIDMEGAKHEIHINDDYANNHLSDPLKKKQLLKIINQCRNGEKTPGEILCDKDYIELMIEATADYGLKKTEYNGERLKKERLIETTLIAGQFSQIKNEKDLPMLVYDMEYDIKLPTRTKKNKDGDDIEKCSKPDFMVFDGERIGIVDLKYDADSMTGDNSLKNHYEDFMDFIWNGDDSYRWGLLDEAIHRMEMMKTAGLINDWNQKVIDLRTWYNNNFEKEFSPDIFWIGFLFVEGPHKKRKNKEKKMIPCKDYVLGEIRLQLKEAMSGNKDRPTQVRFGYCDDDSTPVLTLDKEIRIDDQDEIVIVEKG